MGSNVTPQVQQNEIPSDILDVKFQNISFFGHLACIYWKQNSTIICHNCSHILKLKKRGGKKKEKKHSNFQTKVQETVVWPSSKTIHACLPIFFFIYPILLFIDCLFTAFCQLCRNSAVTPTPHVVFWKPILPNQYIHSSAPTWPAYCYYIQCTTRSIWWGWVPCAVGKHALSVVGFIPEGPSCH